MTHDEMRAIRRDIINKWIRESFLQDGLVCLWCVKFLTRNSEVNRFGKELKAYE